MALTDIITPQTILSGMRVAAKKQALLEISEKFAETTGLAAREIFDALLQRERLGSTGIGNGVAIPHGKLANVRGLHGVFMRLDRAIDFEALDSAPVDLVFALIAPEGAGADHLKALARVARVLRDPSVTAKLRATRNASALYAVLTQEPASHAA